MSLNSKQRAFLKKEAHRLTAIVRIGKDGLTENIGNNLDAALVAKELVKVKILQNAELDKVEVRETAEKLSEMTSSELVGIIGRTMLYYKENEEKPSISLEVKKIK